MLFSGFIELTWEPPQNFDTGKIAWRSTLGQVAWHVFSWLLTLLVGWALFSLFHSAIQNLSSFWRDISPISQNYFVLNKKKRKRKIFGKVGPLYVMDMGSEDTLPINITGACLQKSSCWKKHWVCNMHMSCRWISNHTRHAIANGNILYKTLFSRHYNPWIIFARTQLV